MASMSRRDAPTKYREYSLPGARNRNIERRAENKCTAKCLFEARQNVDKIHRLNARKNKEKRAEKI